MMNAMRVAGRTSASVFRKRVASSAPLRRSMATYFTEDHEYITVEGDVGTVGITDFAQNQMGEIVSVELPEVGDEFEKVCITYPFTATPLRSKTSNLRHRRHIYLLSVG